MLKKTIRQVATQLGFEIRRLNGHSAERANGADAAAFKLHKYSKPDGTFDYERYRQIQIEGNKRKIDIVWVLEPNIEFLAQYITKTIDPPKFGICHGTRRGLEQQWFRKYLGCEVIGTEISDTATQFAHTIQWDFHNVKPEWIDAVDFIYSNSFDHSFDPEKCLNAWMSCVRPGGVCIIEHSSYDTPSAVNELDPFGAELTLLPYLITTWGGGRYFVREIIDAPSRENRFKPTFVSFVVVQRL